VGVKNDYQGKIVMVSEEPYAPIDRYAGSYEWDDPES
jgi:hypothetical protein